MKTHWMTTTITLLSQSPPPSPTRANKENDNYYYPSLPPSLPPPPLPESTMAEWVLVRDMPSTCTSSSSISQYVAD